MTDIIPWLNDEGEQRELPPIPGDCENMNDSRASWALHAVEAFEELTGTDRCDALSDLLVDLMHLCDRDNTFPSFEDALDKAQRCYGDETIPLDDIEEVDIDDVVGVPGGLLAGGAS